MHAIRVLIADDHPVFRQGLLAILRNESEFKVVGEATDGRQALELTRKLNPDILLLDLVMPQLTGLETLRELAGTPAPVRTILLTASIEKEQIAQALQLGARGILLKDAPTDVLLSGIRTVMSGQFWVGQDKVTDLVEILRSYMPAEEQPKAPKKTFGLTARELDVVAAIVSGFTNREIAGKFSISEQTVKHHLRNIFDKVGVSNRLELALFAINHQLVSPVNG
ncbi:MAG TPA: response regulator transcription factor [Terriglobia bacterium]|jgi:DNA-binding NarL/FixJ family response regulator